MSVSHASVHLVEDPPTTDGGNNNNNHNVPTRIRIKDVQGMVGTKGGLAFNLVVVAGLQCMWSLSLAIVDIYALLLMRSLQNHQVVYFFTVGDGVTSTLTFAEACASAGITVLIGNDLGSCGNNHCVKFEIATTTSFISWFMALPSFLLKMLVVGIEIAVEKWRNAALHIRYVIVAATA